MLEKQREQIDRIDRQLIALFEERMAVVREVIKIKQEHQLPILDENREQLVINKVMKQVQSEELEPYAVDWMTELMRISKKYQASIVQANNENA